MFQITLIRCDTRGMPHIRGGNLITQFHADLNILSFDFSGARAVWRCNAPTGIQLLGKCARVVRTMSSGVRWNISYS